jgi:hypothetical protein
MLSRKIYRENLSAGNKAANEPKNPKGQALKYEFTEQKTWLCSVFTEYPPVIQRKKGGPKAAPINGRSTCNS